MMACVCNAHTLAAYLGRKTFGISAGAYNGVYALNLYLRQLIVVGVSAWLA